MINNSSSALEQTGLGFDTDPNTPMDESASQTHSMMSTFKSSPTFSSVPYNQIGNYFWFVYFSEHCNIYLNLLSFRNTSVS